jgi:hypothetical protein
MSAWPFDQPKDCAVFTTTHVMKDGQDIIYVFHDEDDHGWQFHYAGEKDPADTMIVALEEIVGHDSSVLEIADLPPGWKAWRKKRGALWQKAKNENKG